MNELKAAMLVGSVSRRGGGVSDALSGLTRVLNSECGVRVRVVSLHDQDTQRDLKSWTGIPVSLANVWGPKTFGYSPKIAHYLDSAECHIAHVHGIWMYLSIACSRWSGTEHRPYLVSPHGMLESWALRNSAWKKRIAGLLFEKKNLGRAACLHALTLAELRCMRLYGLQNPICVIPNGVTLPTGVPDRPSWDGLVPPGAKVLLYLGRLHPKKGLVNLLYGWKQAQRAAGRNAAEWFLVIAGWDQLEHSKCLTEVCRQARIERSVRFIGPQFGLNKQATFGRAQAFILPSFSEGLPMTVLEAWSYGLPVLMTPQCNLDEGFEAHAAIRINPDCDSISTGLQALFAMSYCDRATVGRRGRALVERRFSWSAVAAELASVYRWILDAGPKPPCVVA